MKSTKYTQPGFLKKTICFFLGHKILYDGFIKERPTPTLQSFIYSEDEKVSKVVGQCFCPRCYSFFGIHYLQEKQTEKSVNRAQRRKK